jgi:hypothetical protein
VITSNGLMYSEYEDKRFRWLARKHPAACGLWTPQQQRRYEDGRKEDGRRVSEIISRAMGMRDPQPPRAVTIN